MHRVFHKFVRRLQKCSTRFPLFQFTFSFGLRYTVGSTSNLYAQTQVSLTLTMIKSNFICFKVFNNLSLHGEYQLEEIQGRIQVCEDPQPRLKGLSWNSYSYHLQNTLELADQRQYGKVIQRDTKNIMQKTLGNLLAGLTSQQTSKTRSGALNNSFTESIENGLRQMFEARFCNLNGFCCYRMLKSTI